MGNGLSEAADTGRDWSEPANDHDRFATIGKVALS